MDDRRYPSRVRRLLASPAPLVVAVLVPLFGSTARGGILGVGSTHTARLDLERGSPLMKKASGTFAPDRAPLGPPQRVEAGGNCVVDLRQQYTFSGTLDGTAEIDYRILTYGPCPAGLPRPGSYRETWIAHGTFSGSFDGAEARARFTYTADVQRGGEVRGRIELGEGLSGELTVQGDFFSGALSYEGDVSSSGPAALSAPRP